MIFVFGSNEGGIHGAGAAAAAFNSHGAIWGKGVGHHGNSYAIPTKGTYSSGKGLFVGSTLPMEAIDWYINEFLAYALKNPELTFQVTRIGCGLAGLKDEDVAPLFVGGQSNVFYDTAWKDFLTDDSQFWGTF